MIASSKRSSAVGRFFRGTAVCAATLLLVGGALAKSREAKNPTQAEVRAPIAVGSVYRGGATGKPGGINSTLGQFQKAANKEVQQDRKAITDEKANALHRAGPTATKCKACF